MGNFRLFVNKYGDKAREEYNKWYREYRAKNRKKMRKYNKKYMKDYRAKNGCGDYNTKWKIEHPIKAKAQRIVRNAIKKGILKRPDKCELCGNKGDIIAHHENYYQPLKVVWLDKPCHRKIHYGKNKS